MSGGRGKSTKLSTPVNCFMLCVIKCDWIWEIQHFAYTIKIEILVSIMSELQVC